MDTTSVTLLPRQSSQIRYTLGGGLPGLGDESPEADGTVFLEESSIFRARSLGEADLGGPVSSEAFVKIDSALREFTSNLPILVIETLANAVNQDEVSAALLVYEPRAALERSSLFGAADLFTRAGIKVRGSSSANNLKFSLRL